MRREREEMERRIAARGASIEAANKANLANKAKSEQLKEVKK